MDRERLALARGLAEGQGGVASRRQLYAAGLSEIHVRRAVESGRWQLHGRQTVAVHTAPLEVVARRWRAVWEVGETIAALDGATALQAAGLRGYDDDRIHVSAVHNHNTSAIGGVTIHKVIRRVPGEVATVGVPRVCPEVAAVRAAHWAVSNRQAALLLLMTVQQKLTTPSRLAAAQRSARGRTRRAFVRQVVRDIAFGVESLGELDFALLCRQRGLPEPSRQVVRRGPRGRIYLDVRWDCCNLVVEIDGAQHREGLNVMLDNLRHNAIVLAGDRVLRIDVIGLRLEARSFLDQVASAHTATTCRFDVFGGHP
jgi:very-short-patch-repair endonuclease